MKPLFERIMEDINGEIRSFDFDVEHDREAWERWATTFEAVFGEKVKELEDFRVLYDELFTPLDSLELARDRLSRYINAVVNVQNYVGCLRATSPGLLMSCRKIADLLEDMVGKK